MEYGIQALAGIGMVFAVITDLWQKKIAVYVIFTITIVLLFMQFCSGNGFIWICSHSSYFPCYSLFLFNTFAAPRHIRNIFSWHLSRCSQ